MRHFYIRLLAGILWLIVAGISVVKGSGSRRGFSVFSLDAEEEGPVKTEGALACPAG